MAAVYALSHLVEAAALFGLLFLTGRLLPARWLRSFQEAALRGPLLIALGTVAWTAVLFVLAAAGMLRPLPVWILAGVVLAISAPRLVRCIGGAPRRLAGWLQGIGWASLVLAGAAALALLCAAAAALLPLLTWDDAVYHLTLPRIWLREQGFVRIPFNVYSNWPLNFELLYSLGLILDDFVLSKLMHFGFGVLVLVAISGYSSSRGSFLAGLCAAVLFLANQIVLFEFVSANVELGFAFFFLLAFVLLEKRLEGGGRSHLVLSAVCCGYVMGAKLSGVFVAVSLLALLIVSATAPGAPRRRLAADGLLFATLCFALAAPWYLKSFLATGDPFHPFGYALFGGREWSPALSEQLNAWNRSTGMGRSASDFLKLPFRLVFQSADAPDRFYGHLSRFWAVCLPVSLIPLAGSCWARRALLVSAVYFALWAFSSQQTRYLVPLLPFLSICAAFGLVRLAAGLRGAGLRRLVPAALTVWLPLLALWVNGSASLLPWRTQVVDFFLGRNGAITADRPPPIFEFIQRRTSPSARLMFLNFNFGFWCDREYLADSGFQASQMNELIRSAGSEEGLGALLARLGITHVLHSKIDWKIPYPAYLFEFLERRTTVVARTDDGELTLYEIRPR